ncbi:MAG: DUF1844 domain-containing protein [Candidatus Omnitrophota bacterium]
MEDDKFVDESWKEAAFRDKEQQNPKEIPGKQKSKIYVKEPLNSLQDEREEDNLEGFKNDQSDGDYGSIEINFLNYVTSLGFQALIFLGEIPHPVTNQKEENIGQAKFLIDTLVMIREKTKGNLDDKEENLLDASIYELQIKYVEISRARKNSEKE